MISIRGLLHNLKLITLPFGIVALLVTFIFSTIGALAVYDRREATYLEEYIIQKQLQRASASPPAISIAFVGDSSCLMGIYIPLVRATLSAPNVESYCTLAYVGARGYAATIDGLVEKGVKVDRFVVVIHAAQFPRDASWDYWTKIAEDGALPKQPKQGLFQNAVRFLRSRVVERAVYTPLRAAYGLYYGGSTELLRILDATHGSAIDPSQVLNIASIESFNDYVAHYPPAYTRFSGSEFPMAITPMFEASLESLADTIRRIGAGRVSLLFTPIPTSSLSSTGAERLARIERDIAGRLGLPRSAILDMPMTLSPAYFSSGTHLNRWGRILYSRDLSRALCKLTPASDRSSCAPSVF